MAIKKAGAFKIKERRNGRFQVLKRGGARVNGADKTRVLEEAGKIKKLKPKAKEAAAAE